MIRRIAAVVAAAVVLGLLAAGLKLITPSGPAGGTSVCAGHPCIVVLGEDAN